MPKYGSEGSHLSILRLNLHSQLRSVMLSQLSATSRYKATKLPKVRAEIIIVDEEAGINKILKSELPKKSHCLLFIKLQSIDI